MTSRPVIGRTRIGLLNTMFSASSSPTWAAVGLPDSRSFRKGCIVIPPIAAFQGRMSGRHLKLRVLILHYLHPLRTSMTIEGARREDVFTLRMEAKLFGLLKSSGRP